MTTQTEEFRTLEVIPTVAIWVGIPLVEEGIRHILKTAPYPTKICQLNTLGAVPENEIARLDPSVLVFSPALVPNKLNDFTSAIREKTQARILALIEDEDTDLNDSLIISGVHGILTYECDAARFLKAVEKLLNNDLWLEREALSRLLTSKLAKGREMKGNTSPTRELTNQEKKILLTIKEFGDLPNKKVAEKLFISEKTLQNHLTSLYTKLNLSNKVGLYMYAQRNAPALSL